MFPLPMMAAAIGGGYKYKLTNLTETRVSATGDVVTGFRLEGDGQAGSGDGNPTISWNNDVGNQWQVPLDATQAALYEVEAVEVSRADPGGNAVFVGTVGAATWQDLDVTKTWTLTQPEDVSINAQWVIDFTIRDKATQTEIVSNRVTLNSQVI